VNILFLTQVLPYPLDAGPKVRAYHVLQYLAQHHQVTLVSFVRASDTQAAIDHLGEFCREVHCLPMPRSKALDAMHLAKSLLTNRPFLIERDWVPAMARLLAGLVERGLRVDAIHADQLWMAPYARWVQQLVGKQQAHRQRSPLITLDQHNAVYLIPQRLAEHETNWAKRALLTLEACKMARYEAEVCAQFDRVTWVTEEDRAAVDNLAAQRNLTIRSAGVIPICTDPESTAVIVRQSGARRVTFVGGLHYAPNADGILWFAKEVFPRVLQVVPDAILTVIGKQPPAELQTLGIPPQNLAVTGYVDDPTPLLAESAVTVVPLHAGGGMRVKILDAWTWGLPVVSTTIGAEGTSHTPSENILIADTPTAFAEAVVRVLQNPVLAHQLAWAGRQHILETYNWRRQYRAWDLIYTHNDNYPPTQVDRLHHTGAEKITVEQKATA
jgi:glycosyltransferase involved in cell wall biosynthesis